MTNGASGSWNPWKERRRERWRRWRAKGLPVWAGQLYIVGLIGGTVWALRAFSEDHWLGWVVAIVVGWGFGLPLVNALVLRGFSDGTLWPWGNGNE